MIRYVALLRGINVGGKNLIKMPELKRSFEDQGFANVETYIQSGNVLFEAEEGDEAALTSGIEEALSKRFGYSAWVTLRSHEQLRAVVDTAPTGFGSDVATYAYDALFLKPPAVAADTLRDVRTRDGVDAAFAGNGVLYFSRLRSRASQSYMSRIVGLPVYQSMTIRNWNTTVKLLERMDRRDVGS